MVHIALTGPTTTDIENLLAEKVVDIPTFKVCILKPTIIFLESKRRDPCIMAVQDDEQLEIEMHKVRSVLRVIPQRCNIASEMWLAGREG